jgi:PAS domain S-box-containing protein
MENNNITRPIASDRELTWDKKKALLSKTDAKGTILYANEAFIEVSGYDEHELVGQPHSIIRHPDMPKVIFKLLWEEIKKGRDFHGIVKNLAKNGRYYWVITEFKTQLDANGEPIGYFGTRRSISEAVVVKFIEPLYKKLLNIEETSGMEASENFLLGFLEERNKNYVEYVDNLVATGVDDGNKVQKGFFARFFSKSHI